MIQQEVSIGYPVHELIATRWSPYSFDPRPVAESDLRSLFEAARWAPSSYNEQPWAYIVATKDESIEFEKLLSILDEGKQVWARDAYALALGVVSLRFTRNGKHNRTAAHDLGLASANLVTEATARGLSVHQMSGIQPDKAREIYVIPDGWEPWTALAIGYAADNEPTSSGGNRKQRTRKPLHEWVFSAEWGLPSPLVTEG